MGGGKMNEATEIGVAIIGLFNIKNNITEKIFQLLDNIYNYPKNATKKIEGTKFAIRLLKDVLEVVNLELKKVGEKVGLEL